MKLKNKDAKITIAELTEFQYYNNAQNIVRVKLKFDGIWKYFDIPLIGNGDYPNPNLHRILLLTAENELQDSNNCMVDGDESLNYPPGYRSPNELKDRGSVTIGNGFLINNTIKNDTASASVSQMGTFNSDGDLTSDVNKIRKSMTPPLNKAYTTTEGEYKGDKNIDNIGIFMTDDKIMLKTSGATLILGPDGISLLGKRTESHTAESVGVMTKNPLGPIVPETMMTFPASIKYIPNIDYIFAIGNAVSRTAAIAQTAGNAMTAVKNLIGV